MMPIRVLILRRTALSAMIGALACAAGRSLAMGVPQSSIDALDQPHPRATNGASWELIADRVMGGASSGRMTRETVAGRLALRMRGAVSLANNGGFVQVALDLAPGGAVDASGWTGIEIDAFGNGEPYNLHLRTSDVIRPWQSYRATFATTGAWRTIRIPFSACTPHRLEVPLDLTQVRRLGIVAIGRAFTADVAIAGLRFYR